MPAAASKIDPDEMTDGELVEAALEQFAGERRPGRKTARRFAEDVIGVDESSLRRWRNGHQAMNGKRRRWFINYLTHEVQS